MDHRPKKLFPSLRTREDHHATRPDFPRASSFRPTLEELEPRWVPANVGSPNQNFIDQIYRDVLHRPPDAGAGGWVVALDAGSDCGDVVDSILRTDEGLRNQVNDLYVRFLGRPADSVGLTAWVNYLRDGNSNLELAARLIASPEYYQNAGGTDAGFLNAVYRDVLGRSIDLQEIDDRGDGFDDRQDIAEGILRSSEARDARPTVGGELSAAGGAGERSAGERLRGERR